jgi:hypothetical protein
MRELKQQADDRSKWETVVGLPSTAGLVGHPVHFIDGQWYLEMRTGSSSWPYQLQMLEAIEQGTWKSDLAANRIRVWDRGLWLEFPMELLDGLDIRLLSDGNLSDYDIARLKEAKVEWDSEAERLALRQLLAESQAEEDEGDGAD